jgi:hypothetical protein
MNADQKVRIVLMIVSAALPLAATALAVHGIVLPLGDPTGGIPH